MKAIILPILLIMSNLHAQQDSLQTKETDSLKINQIAEVIVMAKNPISQQFSVQKLSKLDIYFNPAASGDPLKAIATLPASTNVEETANPTLRGGSATRSRVYLNGSPVQNLVRFSRGDGLGDFSLMNFTMGSIHSAIKNFQIFNGLSFKTRIFSGLTAQYGIDFSKDEVRYDEMLPLYSFSLKLDNQQVKNCQNLGFHFVEPYFYAQYSVSPKIKISSAVRKNIFLHKDAENFVSYQFSVNYKPNNAHRFLLSGGKYHSYNTPNFFVRNFNLLSSK